MVQRWVREPAAGGNSSTDQGSWLAQGSYSGSCEMWSCSDEIEGPQHSMLVEGHGSSLHMRKILAVLRLRSGMQRRSCDDGVGMWEW